MKSKDKVCLMNILDDLLARRAFVTALTLFAYKRKCILNSLVNIDYINIYTIVNETLVSNIYRKLQIELLSLLKPKSLRNYNDKLLKNSITHFLLLGVEIDDYKKSLCPILIASLEYYSVILKKS